MLTDRNDLDDQLFTTFSRCADLLRQPPVQAENRADLRAKLAVESGGVVFTTIQKFFPEEKGDRHPLLSDRRNIVVIADEAHRSQYDFIDGYARHMRDALPNASFIGFTGTPIELADASTRAVFGDHISVYDIQRAVDDEATVPIYYESRLAELALDETERPADRRRIRGSDRGRRGRPPRQTEDEVGAARSGRWCRATRRAHRPRHRGALRESRGRDGRQGDGGLHEPAHLHRPLPRAGEPPPRMARRRRHPRGAEGRDDRRRRPTRPTGSRTSATRPGVRRWRSGSAIPADPLRMVLVRDMWLTGFDAPSLHTMYVDKPMRGHGLMQAIARVNRVFRDKPGGLVVDYLGLAHELKRALATYTESGGKGQTAVDQEQAVRAMLEKYEVCCGLFHGFDRSAWVDRHAGGAARPAAGGAGARPGSRRTARSAA